MNLKKNLGVIAGFLALTILLSVTGCSTALPYQESRRGNYLYLNPFSHKPESSQAHLAYAQSLREKGRAGKALDQFEILVKRWPDSAEASVAQKAVADLYLKKGKNKKAFEAYEKLIAEYYSGLRDYDNILENQLQIAEHEMNRKRMRWLFGGYRAPERAIPYLESILSNAPQWDKSPELQYLIGKAYQENDDLEMAIVAYSVVEYRYPESDFAEKAAFAKIESLKRLVHKTPYSVDIREQAEVSAGLFVSLYPESEHIPEVTAFIDELHERAAQLNYEIADFYKRVPRPAQTNAAAMYYKKTIEEFGGTESAVKAAEQLQKLGPSAAVSTGAVAENGAGRETAPVGKPRTRPEPAKDIAGIIAALQNDGSSAGGSGASSNPAKANVAPLPERTTTDDEAVEVTADRLEYDNGLLIAEGNVAVQQEGASLQADRVTVNPETGEITAAGNILMMRYGISWEGQELEYNYKTREGSFGNSIFQFEPAYITAGKTERISTNEFLLQDVMMTTCSGDDPVIYAKAKEVRLTDDGSPGDPFIQAKHITFYVGPVPVFYTPVWQRHLGYRVFSFTVGAGDRLGGFVLGSAQLHPTDWLMTKTHFDVYSKRGLGVGQDASWTTPNGRGGIKTYYIDDQDPVEDDDLIASERSLIDSERYRIRLDHREQIDDETYAAAQLNWLSDPVVIEDFFNEEFRRNVNPENYAVLQRSNEHYALGLRADHRMNDFYTAVDRSPELNFDWYRGKLGNSPFYFESENSVGLYEYLNAETNLSPVLRPDNYRTARVDTYNRLFLPLRFKEFFNVIPRAGYRGTWYSETASGASDSNYRNVFEMGTLSSFKAYKTLTGKSGFFGDGLRHVLEPYADYTWRSTPGLRPGDLYQFDESPGVFYDRGPEDEYEDIDEWDKRHDVQFGLRNFLQTKRGMNRIANVLDADVYTRYRLEQYPGQEEFGPLVADAEMSLTDHFSIYGDTKYDWYTHDLTPANARLIWITDDFSEYSVGYRYRDDSVANRSLVTTSVRLFPNSKWSYEFGARYDGTRDEWEDRRILVSHRFDCVGMGVGYRSDEDDEDQVWVQFWLTAFDRDNTDLGR